MSDVGADGVPRPRGGAGFHGQLPANEVAHLVYRGPAPCRQLRLEF